jgi:hypothetical protein
VFFPCGLKYIFNSGLFLGCEFKININDMGDSSVKFAKGFIESSFSVGYKFK